MTATYLRVKNWKQWQHYKDREPPWLKLHSKLLRDSSFLELSEERQWQLVRIWMVATMSSRFTLDEDGRKVPVVANDEKTIRRATASLKKVPLGLFVTQGWLIEVDEGALVENPPADSTPLATGLHDASPDASALLGTEEQRFREEERPKGFSSVPGTPGKPQIEAITPNLREIA